jgi:hypothetical protein
MTTDDLIRLDAALAEIRAEVIRARSLHKPFNSPHEAYAILQEEVDEYWDDVKRDRRVPAAAEAVQVGAVAARIVMEFVDPSHELFQPKTTPTK